MNARAEAVARLGGAYDARVLEPSPPAVAEPPWFADDPVGRGERRGTLPRVSPVAGGDLRWEELCTGNAALAEWCAERWLAGYRALVSPPAELVHTREALHALARCVLAPTREHANTKIGLRFTRGGFGTPFFGADVQLRVRGERLIVQQGEREREAPISTLAHAAEHVGEELLPGGVDDGRALRVDAAASSFIGDWFGFATSVLEELRASAGDGHEPSRVQLWPEHFDVSVELGSERAGKRAGYGASPGDEAHPEPYVYVVPWGKVPDGELWQATAFAGAELSYSELLAAGAAAPEAGSAGKAQRDIALRFLSDRLSRLVS